MKWEPNITGYPIDVLHKQGHKPDDQQRSEHYWRGRSGPTQSIKPNSATVRTSIIDLSDNVMLAHYQRERR